jgi:glutamate-ammonia-ligase adenylyltransferase
MRLRPFGSQGQLVGRREGLERYYHTQARPWEVQALLKARPVLGDGPAASALVRQLLLQGVQRWADHDFVAEVARARHVAQGRRGLLEGKALNVKTGAGGIRDIEFSVQLLQLRHCRLNPDVLMPDTLGGLRRLVARGALPAPAAEAAADHYRLLRRLEHLLQIMHDRQIHNMPTDTDSLRALARRLLGAAADPQRLRTVVEAAMAANRDLFRATAGTG